MSQGQVLADGQTDPVIGDMKISALLESLLGTVRAKQLMERLNIAESERVQGIGVKLHASLLREIPYSALTLGAGVLVPPLLLDDEEAVAVAISLCPAGPRRAAGRGRAVAGWLDRCPAPDRGRARRARRGPARRR